MGISFSFDFYLFEGREKDLPSAHSPNAHEHLGSNCATQDPGTPSESTLWVGGRSPAAYKVHMVTATSQGAH